MEISKWLLIGAAEIYAVMICFLVFLLFNVKGLRKLINKLQSRIKGLNEELEELKEEKAASSGSATDAPEFLRQLKGQVQLTKKHHGKVAGHHDVDTSLAEADSIEAQAVALRHAFLKNEIQAFTTDESSKTPKWASLYEGFAGILDKIKPSNNTEENTSDKALKDNFEEIINLAKAKGADGEIEAALLQYRDLLANLRSDTVTEIPSKGKSDESVQALKTFHSDQFNNINQWLDRIEKNPQSLADSKTGEDLKAQLQQQTRYLQESEACVALLEKEIETCYAQIDSLQDSANTKTSAEPAQVNQLVSENQKLKKHIKQQDSEIEQLLAQMHMSE
ncbi:hypothetical protein [Sessilibacter corallicola]|uniref:Uncharacterized protein n=1 Tax=Sessilibacter corallicola TaxID=2904075 RepID=A0ABQ0A6P0_9GAMM